MHFWIHNFGLIGMVVLFTMAGIVGGSASVSQSPEAVEALIRPILATMGIFGSLVLLANLIWGYNIFRTAVGWAKDR